jgi:hypothetical protein
MEPAFKEIIGKEAQRNLVDVVHTFHPVAG